MITMDDITGSAYERFIDYALAHTDAFMFVGCNYYNSRIYKTHVKPFIKELQPYAIKRRHDPQWPGTVQAGTDRYQRRAHIRLGISILSGRSGIFSTGLLLDGFGCP